MTDKYDVDSNKDLVLLKKLNQVTDKLILIDEKVEGGLEGLGFDSEISASDEGTFLIQLAKMEAMLTSACELLIQRADELEQEGVDDDESERVMLALYYRGLVESIKDQLSSAESESESKKKQEVVSDRRKAITGSVLALGAVAGLGGGALYSSPSQALGGAGDAGIIASIKEQTAVHVTNAKKRYADVIKTIQNIQKLFDAVNVVNNAIIGGFDSLLSFTNENEMKKIVADMTAADQQRAQDQQNERIHAEQGSKQPSGACVSDSSSMVMKKTDETVKDAVGTVTDSLTKTRLGLDHVDENGNTVKVRQITSLDLADDVLKEMEDSNAGSFNFGKMINNSSGTSEKEARENQSAFLRATAEPTDVVYGNLSAAASTEAGRKYIVEVATRSTRRSVAEGVLAKFAQEATQDPNSYKYLYDNLDNLITDTPPNDFDEDGNAIESFVDNRMVAHAESLIDELESLKEESGGAGLSKIQALDFLVRTKNTSSFSEFVRSSGFHPTPLIREVVEQNSISLKLNLEGVMLLREISALLANLFLETQDSPERIDKLNSLKRS